MSRGSLKLITVLVRNIKKLSSHKLYKFLFVSVLNTAFGYGLFALLIFIELPYQLVLLIGTIIGILFNFKTLGIIVFKQTENRLFVKFIGVYALVYLFNVACLSLFKYFSISVYVAGAA
jgi:putative flippase GtrA